MLKIGLVIITLMLVFGAIAQQPATPPSASLKFLSQLEGKYPSDAKVFANPAMKARMSDLLKKNAALVPERFQTAGPIRKKGDIVSMSGNKAHQGGIDEALIVVNAKTDEMWVWLKVKGALS